MTKNNEGKVFVYVVGACFWYVMGFKGINHYVSKARPYIKKGDASIIDTTPLCECSDSYFVSSGSIPASSGSIMMRPQYSHTIIFLCILISSCFWGGMRLKQPPQALRWI